MRTNESAENYLEAILTLSRSGAVRAVDVANELAYTKPSVSVAMKNLRQSGHIVTNRDGHITLTESGRKIAEAMYERHTLFSDWLVLLGVDRETAAGDACRMEHVLSEKSFNAIKRHITAHEYK